MQNFYEQCINIDNIKQAIQYYINLHCIPNNYDETLYIKEVKLRLRRYKKINNKNEIIFDKITFRAVYQILSQVIKINNNVYFNKKILLSKLCTYINHSKYTYSIDFDLKELLNNISIDQILDSCRQYINDNRLIKTIKHLLWYSKEYNGIGILLNNQLYVLIAHCFLSTLDNYISNNIDSRIDKNRLRNFDKHKGYYASWLMQHNKRPNAHYYRYINYGIILCHSREEQLMILSLLQKYFTQYNINNIFNLQFKKIIFLNFKIYKSESSISITIANETILRKKIKQYKWKSIQEIKQFLFWLEQIFIKYDIVNNMENFINYLTRRMLYIAKRKSTNLIKKPNHLIFKYIFNKQEIIIDPYKMRKQTRKNYKQYLIHL